MKRISPESVSTNSEAITKVTLVERNPNPDGLHLVNAYRVGRKDPDELVILAKQIQLADIQIRNNACGKLSIIAEQVRFLQSQAKKILEEAELNANLHHAACNFKKNPGQIYHLYERESRQRYFSMLSPEEWGKSLKHKHLGSYRLESDQSWTSIEKIEEHSQNMMWAENLLNSKSKNIFAIENGANNNS